MRQQHSVNYAHLNAQELLPKGSVPDANVGDGARNEKIGTTCGEDNIVHACKVARPT